MLLALFGQGRADVTTTGDVDPSGATDPWEVGDYLMVGNSGNGTLVVEAGGMVSSVYGHVGNGDGSTGMATITGTSSQWNNSSELRVGWRGNGTLKVEAGGVVSNTNGHLGRNFSSTGTVRVNGDGSEWNNSGGLNVGYADSGTLSVEAGGAVSSLYGYIGRGSGSTGEATVTDADSEWKNSISLTVGSSGNGRLNVEAGGEVSNTRAYLGFNLGSTGEARVAGAGSKWTNSNSLFIGGGSLQVGGSGILNVNDSGLVDVADRVKLWSRGTLNLDGGNLTTGSFDNSEEGTFNFYDGTLTVQGAGGFFDPGVDDFRIDGNTADDTPELVIAGTASATLAGNLDVGAFRQGRLTVNAGGKVSNASGSIGTSRFTTGETSTGEARVTGDGSEWNNSGQLSVGSSGNGTLRVEAGGVVSNTHSYIGRTSGSTGAATVTDAGSEWNHSGSLSVGSSGNGTLHVEAGGVVSSTNGLVGSGSGSTGTATLSGAGSEWNNSKSLFIGGGSLAAGGNGTLNIYDSGLVKVNFTTKLWNAGTINIDGGTLDVGLLDLTLGTVNMLDGLLSADSVVGDINVQGGTVAPGNSPGTLSISGDYIQGAAATLQIELGGTVRGDEYDAMIVSGDVTLDGSLDVLAIGGYAPQAGDLFDILDFEPANLSGLFDNVSLPALASDLEWDQTNLYTTGELLVSLAPSQISGDFNYDGIVDAADYTLWQDNLGLDSSVLNGNGSGGATVVQADYDLWKTHFGQSTAGGSQADPVPEPATLLLALLALACVPLRMRCG